jgi:hypothetical protein
VGATRRGAGFQTANMNHAICVGFLRGPLNFRVGSAIENATVVVADWVAWRRVCNVRRLTATRRSQHVSTANFI